jgi:PucR C-terminal helix-turn-helix domain
LRVSRGVDKCWGVLADGARTRLSDTLLVSLEHDRAAPKAGAEIRPHTQTVCYSLSPIRELFPNGLHDSTARVEHELALRAEQFTTMSGVSTVDPS